MGWLPHALDLQWGEGAIRREDGKISVDYDGMLESGFLQVESDPGVFYGCSFQLGDSRCFQPGCVLVVI